MYEYGLSVMILDSKEWNGQFYGVQLFYLDGIILLFEEKKNCHYDHSRVYPETLSE